MSKQERDQDEQRASSGVGKGDTSATPADSAKDKPAPRPETDKQRITDKPPGADGDKANSAKSETAKTQAPAQKAKRETKPSPEKSSAKSAGAIRGKRQSAPSDKTSATNAKAAAPGAQSGKAQDSKPQEPSKSSVPGSDKPANATGAASPPTPPKHSVHSGGDGGGGRAGIVTMLLVVLLALVVLLGGWWGWQKLSAQQARLAQVENNANAITELESRLESQFAERDRQRNQALQAMRDEMQRYRDDVNRTLDRVLEELAREQDPDPSEWTYAEVEYLLRLANQRLQLERDISGARSLLRTADERVAQADNPALTAVRRAIQSELAALDSVAAVDRTGLYLALVAQQEQLAKLPLKQDVEQIVAEGGDTSPMDGAWREQLSRLGEELKELVVIRRHDQAFEALITPKQEAYLRQNVRLQLEQAQLAVLDGNSQLLKASLEKATALIERYYNTKHGGVQASLKKLRSLAAENIRPELPDISGSLQALRDFMERRHDGGSADE